MHTIMSINGFMKNGTTLLYDWKTNNSRQKTEDYNKMLERNGMSHSDRTNHLYEF